MVLAMAPVAMRFRRLVIVPREPEMKTPGVVPRIRDSGLALNH